jgi:hypothetical protein
VVLNSIGTPKSRLEDTDPFGVMNMTSQALGHQQQQMQNMMGNIGFA